MANDDGDGDDDGCVRTSNNLDNGVNMISTPPLSLFIDNFRNQMIKWKKTKNVVFFLVSLKFALVLTTEKDPGLKDVKMVISSGREFPFWYLSVMMVNSFIHTTGWLYIV